MQIFNTAACLLLLSSGVAVNALPITDQAAALSPRAGTPQNLYIGKGWKYLFTTHPKALKKTHDFVFGKPKTPKKIQGPVKAPEPSKKGPALFPRAAALQNPWIGKGWPKYPDMFTKDPKTLKKTHDLLFGKPKAPNTPPLKVKGPVKAPKTFPLVPRTGALQNLWIGKGWPKYPDMFTKDPKTLKKTHDLLFGKPKAPNTPPLKVKGPVKAPKTFPLVPRTGPVKAPTPVKGL
ncbi:hypothetical protein HYFRA_00012705 [Hymenoscyphus fraxineus]|uniref:Uncharacterized protein n=1 Tax=Hymenoscyphus fraxineus TaxID=746836 RepID=A0A9N9L8F5_9HELO|nr:hypothetical protein HYFRA_00012705 [Hymenoscyphus fraxineus]